MNSTENISLYERIRQLQQKVTELENENLAFKYTISEQDGRIEELEDDALETMMHDVEFEIARQWFEQMKFGKPAKELVQELFREHGFLYEERAA